MRRKILALALSALALNAAAMQEPVVAVGELDTRAEPTGNEPIADYNVEMNLNAGFGNFAPYYVMSNDHGVLTQPFNAQVRANIIRPLSRATRFSYGFGIDGFGGYSSTTPYTKFDPTTGEWVSNPQRGPWGSLHQLYGEIKFRGVFLTVGMKEYHSGILNEELSSGDVTFSGNTRPMPGARIGFIDFQNIPFTNGWVQIQGEIGYGRSLESHYLRDRFSNYTGRINTGWWYNYKRCYFRSKPSQPFCVIAGMQAAGQFGGLLEEYYRGKIYSKENNKPKIMDFLHMFIPGAGEAYWYGNHVGSWDFRARYRFRNGDKLYGYFEWLWEDGSGIGKQNGFDGLWGLEYKKAGREPVTGVVFEYLDFTNQSGPMHWDVEDENQTTLQDRASGMDNYYNNFKQNSYSYYGMGIGTPFIPSPIYNLDGNLQYTCNRIRGFHLALKGNVSAEVDWLVKFSWRKGWGTFGMPFTTPKEDTSMLVEFLYTPKSIPGFSLKGQAAFDKGELFGNNVGARITLCYSGEIRKPAKKSKP